MFDIFYSGNKPNLFAFEKPASSLEEAALMAKTSHYWYIYGDNDYTGFNFDYIPVPWEREHLHVWPTQWNEFGGAFLVCKDTLAERKWHHHEQVIKTRASLVNWSPSPYSLDFDFSWVPHPFDPPYIYIFGNQWHSAERMPTLEYHVEGATERKYVHKIFATLADNRTNWETLIDCEFDYSWCPDPFDPPYIYVFGNQWYSAEIQPTVRYTVPGATETKYLDYPRAVLPQSMTNWTVPDTIDQSSIDFSWVPDPGSPPYIYHFGSEWQETTGLTYTVPKATEIKLMGPAPSVNGHITQTPTIFFIDKGNKLANHRFDTLTELGLNVVRTRYFSNMFDTISRCIKKCNTTMFWVISSENDYTEFDFTWHPNSWQYNMTHVFGSKWNKWTDTFLINKHEFKRHGAWASSIEQFPNLNFVKDQLVATADDSSDIYYIDHGNTESLEQYETLKSKHPNIRTTRFVDNYLDTFKRIMTNVTTDNVWILNSICDYTNFDFTWQPGAWERNQIHCFSNSSGDWMEKRGDTFYIPVEIFKSQMYELELLDWFNVISYNTTQEIKRWPMPIVMYEGDDLVSVIKQHEFKSTFTVFTKDPRVTSNFIDDCVWTEKDRTIRPFNLSGSTSLVPRDIKKYLKTQVYDYPHLYKYETGLPYNYYSEKPQDVIFISYDETNADENFEKLKRQVDTIPYNNINIKRLHGVEGMDNALKRAAEMSETPWYFAVFAKTKVAPDFRFNFNPDYWQQPKHYIFYAQNPMNGLSYGHMGIVLYNCNIVKNMTEFGIDYTMSAPHEVVPEVSAIAEFNTTPYQTWRTAFRECAKLSQFVDEQGTLETEHRLKIWTTRAEGNHAEWCLRGANDGVKFYQANKNNKAQLKNAFNWAWLQQHFDSMYTTV